MTDPFILVLKEPNKIELSASFDHADSGVIMDISDDALPQGVKACIIALSANQTISLLEGLKKLEQVMRQEIAEGRGGREGPHFKVNEN